MDNYPLAEIQRLCRRFFLTLDHLFLPIETYCDEIVPSRSSERSECSSEDLVAPCSLVKVIKSSILAEEDEETFCAVSSFDTVCACACAISFPVHLVSSQSLFYTGS